ncbi:MAG TPA: ChaN family lipoprotein [Sediminibacterium sp.]|nr:ChaN family lipoprotein [Sediminibacterium sp.]
MKKQVLLLTLLISASGIFAQGKTPYIIYNSKGRQVTYQKMIRILKEKDIVLFGEYHNNAIAHWLQLEVTKDLHQNRQIILGAEMFEADNQDALNQYLSGKLSSRGLDSSARLWKNYTTDYAPLLNYAKSSQLPFIATNIPRKYAAMVSKGGFTRLDSLTEAEKKWIAPLPMAYDKNLPGYVKMMEMMAGHGSENMPKAQASKDATMAYFILRNLQAGSLFLHYNGSYHSDFYDGINWYLKREKPDLKYGTISTVSQKNIKSLLTENKGRADFIICVDEDMTNTY